MAGTLFCLAGLIITICAAISGEVYTLIPIAMMFVCIGLVID